MKTPTNTQCYLLLVCGCLTLYFLSLGNYDLSGRDEIRRAKVVQVMVNTGDYLIPRLGTNAKPYLSKPPQYYWHALAFSKLLNTTNEWTTRLPSAFAALITVLLLFTLSLSLSQNRSTALLAATILLLSPLFIKHARMATLDLTLCMFETLALCSFYFAAQTPSNKKKQALLALAAISLGFAFVTKGPIGIITPLVGIITWLLLTRSYKQILSKHTLWHIALFLCIASPWFVKVYIHLSQNGIDPWQLFFHETVTVAVDSYAHKRPFYYYLLRLPIGIVPWSIFFVTGLISHKHILEKYAPAKRFALCIFLPNFILFSLFSSKQAYYLLPLFPAASLYTAIFIQSLLQTSDTKTPAPFLHWSLFAHGLLLNLAAVAASITIYRLNIPALRPYAILLATLTILASILVAIRWTKHHYKKTLILLIASQILLFTFWMGILLPRYTQATSIHKLANQINHLATTGKAIKLFHISLGSLSVYCHPKLTNLPLRSELEKGPNTETLEQLLASPTNFLIISPDNDLQYLPMDRLKIVSKINTVRHGNQLMDIDDFTILERR